MMISPQYEAYIAGLSGGTNINNLKFNELGQFAVPRPAIAEQRRIVGILDEAFAAIATARANTEKNLQNARELLSTSFNEILQRRVNGDVEAVLVADLAERNKGSIRTGPFGSQLLHSEFVDKGVVVLGIDNAVANEFRPGKTRCITSEKAQSLQRYHVFEGDVIITIMGTCGRCAVIPKGLPPTINSKHLCCITLDRKKCLPHYLHGYFPYHPKARDFLAGQSKGSIMEGLNMGIIKELPVLLPSLSVQREIVDVFSTFRSSQSELLNVYEQKLTALDALKQSLLHHAFTGQLADASPAVSVAAAPVSLSTTDLHAGILALAWRRHENAGKTKLFGHVKAEKIAHLVETHLGIDLGRNPVKDAAGPNDYPHLKKVEHRAKMVEWFRFQGTEAKGYTFTKSRNFDALIDKTMTVLGERRGDVDRLLEILLPLDMERSEVVATVYAAWNNLLLDGTLITDEAIVHEAREGWHPNKLKIDRDKFYKSIDWLKKKGLVPSGRGKPVRARAIEQTSSDRGTTS